MKLLLAIITILSINAHAVPNTDWFGKENNAILSGWLYTHPNYQGTAVWKYSSDVVSVIENTGTWCKVKVLKNERIGYVETSCLSENTSKPSIKLSSTFKEQKERDLKIATGVFQVLAGVTGTIFTFISVGQTYEHIKFEVGDDQNPYPKIETEEKRMGWHPMHTVTISLSIGAIISGILQITANSVY